MYEGAPVRFALGRVVATPGALEALQRAGDMPEPLFTRHQRGDFGDLDADDVRLQNLALQQEREPERRERMMSVYRLSDGTVLWVITEADRSATTLLLPDEY